MPDFWAICGEESFLSRNFHENGGSGISEWAILGILRVFRCYDISDLRMRKLFKYMWLIGISARFISNAYHGVILRNITPERG